MALKRLALPRRHDVAGVFQDILICYNGDYSEQTQQWEVPVLAADVPTTPTDAELKTDGDAKATTIYNDWKARIDADTVVKTTPSGFEATVIA